MPGLPSTFAATVLDFITGRGTATYYVALLGADPGDDATMGGLPEITDVGYARQAVTYSLPALNPRATANTALFTYGPFPNGMALGATYIALVEAATGSTGSVRYVWMLNNVLGAAAGESVQFPTAALSLGW